MPTKINYFRVSISRNCMSIYASFNQDQYLEIHLNMRVSVLCYCYYAWPELTCSGVDPRLFAVDPWQVVILWSIQRRFKWCPRIVPGKFSPMLRPYVDSGSNSIQQPQEISNLIGKRCAALWEILARTRGIGFQSYGIGRAERALTVT